MYAPDLTVLLNTASVWGPCLSILAALLLAAQRAWVAYLKHRGADYVRAQAELLRAQNEPEIKRLEIAGKLLLAELGHRNVSPETVAVANTPADNAKPLPLKSAQRSITPEDMDKAA